eukprot:gnl/TRDRNA2_/TRDRNA2_158728_c0_seq1.p1 gnl/TRDRNA2_/TRDRNA2_158728_c0~~gnl/TRDRNA2_/TRDRNA2_158728_c0_seq1.p1  ORF type:complete len:1093 (+),score=94.02 gnl/TRDRNA2_/TRDRNA2_158728_c0_seq1:1-3279(+)
MPVCFSARSKTCQDRPRLATTAAFFRKPSASRYRPSMQPYMNVSGIMAHNWFLILVLCSSSSQTAEASALSSTGEAVCRDSSVENCEIQSQAADDNNLMQKMLKINTLQVHEKNTAQSVLRTFEEADGKELHDLHSHHRDIGKRCAVVSHTYISDQPCHNVGDGAPGGFLVTGVGRSGTSYLTELLNGLGLRVSHDDAPRGKDGAVSWVHGMRMPDCSLPSWAHDVRRFFGDGYLMARDPLQQIASHSDNGDFARRQGKIMVNSKKGPEEEIWAFIRCTQSVEPLRATDPVNRSVEIALKHYVIQNSFILQYVRHANVFKVEDVAEKPHIVRRLFKQYGGSDIDFTDANIRSVILSLGTRTNSEHTETTSGVTWARLAEIDHDFAVMAQQQAQVFGYEIPYEEELFETRGPYGPQCGWDAGGPWRCNLTATHVVNEPFSLDRLVRFKDSKRSCSPPTEPLPELNHSAVVSVAVARTGSETVTDFLKAHGQPAFHKHSCTLDQIMEAGAGVVIISLRDPVSRYLSGVQRRTEGNQADKRSNHMFTDNFEDADSFVTALRDVNDEKHSVALQITYQPSSQMWMVPVVEFYLAGNPTVDPNRVKFVCTPTLTKDLQRTATDLGLAVPEGNESEIHTHKSNVSSDSAHAHSTMLSDVNREWLQEIYSADYALFDKHCGASHEIISRTATAIKWEAYQRKLAQALRIQSPIRNDSIRVLIVSVVDDSPETARRFTDNLRKLQTEIGNDTFHLALFHTSETNVFWKDQDWYSNITGPVVKAAFGPICKAQAWFQIAPSMANKYDYLWLLDSDIGFELFSWDLYREVLRAKQPLVSQPSILPAVNGNRSSDIQILRMHGPFKGKPFPVFMEVMRTEVMSPLLRSNIWSAVHNRLRDNDNFAVSSFSDMWDLLATLSKLHSNKSGPLLVNSAPLRHMNTVTIPPKQREDGTSEEEDATSVVQGIKQYSHNRCTRGCGKDRRNCRPATKSDKSSIQAVIDIPLHSPLFKCGNQSLRRCRQLVNKGMENLVTVVDESGRVSSAKYRCECGGQFCGRPEDTTIVANAKSITERFCINMVIGQQTPKAFLYSGPFDREALISAV